MSSVPTPSDPPRDPPMRLRPRFALAVLILAPLASAQYAERPALVGSGAKAVDASGRSVASPRVRAVHTTDATLAGGTAWLIGRDPWLAYQLGRDLNFREFRERDGVFDAHVSNLAGPMPDGTTAKITANNQTSCLGCHNLPNGTPGGGANFSKDSGRGRNSPHYFGAGVVEMLAIQVRQRILEQVDVNQDGWISAAECQAAPGSCVVPSGAGAMIDYGSVHLSQGSTGVPALNNIFRVWYLDANGVVVPGATSIDGVNTFGFNFEMVVWGWGQGVGRSALNPTNRAFLWDPFKAHGGLESYDPSTTLDPDGDGVSVPTLAGAIQFPATHQPTDKGANLDPLGFSRDDPDGDGYLNELSEGDLDLGEWFMLNAPRPAFAGTPQEYAAGVRALRSMDCLSCHVPDWRIEAAGNGFAGDRRFFDLSTTWSAQAGRLEGQLLPLTNQVGGVEVRKLGSFDVAGLFSDLRHHEMGEGFAELDFSGTVNTTWRTPPLWGVGSGFPWGHDGASLTLADAILRHGGEAAAARAAWVAASPGVRRLALDFLAKLVLYDLESLPTDLDGDGVISDAFVVAGVDTGVERFYAPWLFDQPVRIQGLVSNIDGVTIRSFAPTNRERAYGMNLLLLRDGDLDGWPDVWDAAPGTPGFRDGVQ